MSALFPLTSPFNSEVFPSRWKIADSTRQFCKWGMNEWYVEKWKSLSMSGDLTGSFRRSKFYGRYLQLFWKTSKLKRPTPTVNQR